MRYTGFLTFALNYRLHGLNVTGFHLFNISIHIINAILIYHLVILTFKTPFLRGQTDNIRTQYLIALFTALLFISHPIQTQAVTYIAQRFASLATFFYLLSLVMYIEFRIHDARYMMQDTPPFNSPLAKGGLRGVFYLVSLISAILAMKTKEIAFTLPVIIIIYEFLFFDEKIKRRILYLIPFILTMLIIPLNLIDIDKPLEELIGDVNEATRAETNISRWNYLFTQLRVIVTYIRLLFLPINQNLDYDYPIYNSFLNPNIFLSFLFLLLIFVLAIYLLYRSRFNIHILPSSVSQLTVDYKMISFGIFWFFATLSVESSIIPTKDVIFEHRAYLPSVGVFFAITTSTFIATNKLRNRWSAVEKAIKYLFILIIIVLTVFTYARNIVWQVEISLFEDVVKKSPEKERGHYNLGNAYQKHGSIDKAIEHFQVALKLWPDYAEAHNNIGVAYALKELPEKAIEHYQIALRLKPDYADAHFNLGVICIEIGAIDNARKELEMVLQMNPDHYQAKQFLKYMSSID